MEKPEYKNMFSSEDTHFYYVSLHKLVLQFLKQYIYIDFPQGDSKARLHGNDKELRLLDAGCGTGRLAELMSAYGNVIGIDMSEEALKFAERRSLTVKKASVTKLPFPDNSFDVVTSIDVIVSKGIKDDMEALNEFYRVLKPNGILILRVSAIQWLKVSHDRFVHSNKRYSKSILQKKLINAGFTIEKLSYMNMILAPIGIIQHFYEKLFPQKKDHSSISETNSVINTVATNILNVENSLLRSLNLPFGLGLIAVVKK